MSFIREIFQAIVDLLSDEEDEILLGEDGEPLVGES